MGLHLICERTDENRTAESKLFLLDSVPLKISVGPGTETFCISTVTGKSVEVCLSIFVNPALLDIDAERY
jgi:hypothetical protein